MLVMCAALLVAVGERPATAFQHPPLEDPPWLGGVGDPEDAECPDPFDTEYPYYDDDKLVFYVLEDVSAPIDNPPGWFTEAALDGVGMWEGIADTSGGVTLQFEREEFALGATHVDIVSDSMEDQFAFTTCMNGHAVITINEDVVDGSHDLFLDDSTPIAEEDRNEIVARLVAHEVGHALNLTHTGAFDDLASSFTMPPTEANRIPLMTTCFGPISEEPAEDQIRAAILAQQIMGDDLGNLSHKWFEPISAVWDGQSRNVGPNMGLENGGIGWEITSAGLNISSDPTDQPDPPWSTGSYYGKYTPDMAGDLLAHTQVVAMHAMEAQERDDYRLLYSFNLATHPLTETHWVDVAGFYRGVDWSNDAWWGCDEEWNPQTEVNQHDIVGLGPVVVTLYTSLEIGGLTGFGAGLGGTVAEGYEGLVTFTGLSYATGETLIVDNTGTTEFPWEA